MPSATGTGTLLLHLQDVNDNPPLPDPRNFEICSRKPEPQRLSIVDKDIPPNTHPYSAELTMGSSANWTARVNSGELACLQHAVPGGGANVPLEMASASGGGIWPVRAPGRTTVCVPRPHRPLPACSLPPTDNTLTLVLIKTLEPGEYGISLKLTDGQGLAQVTTVTAHVCNCEGAAANCDKRAFVTSGMGIPAILGILGGILAVLSE